MTEEERPRVAGEPEEARAGPSPSPSESGGDDPEQATEGSVQAAGAPGLGEGLLLESFFHRLNNVIPEEQVVRTLSPEDTVAEALQIMAETGFSQLPVVRGEAVLGSFSFRSFALGAVEYEGRVALSELPVEEFLESLETAHATDELKSVFDALDADGAVLIGTVDDLQALLTSMDVLRYLYRVTEPYVQLGEVERSLRRIVQTSTTEDELAACAHRSLANLYEGREDDIPVDAEQMTLGELVVIVRDGRNFPNFAGFLGAQRELAAARLGPLPGLRNDVFHFRRELTEDERSEITEARNWLLRRLRGREGAQ